VLERLREASGENFTRCCHLSYPDSTCAHASMGKDGSCVEIWHVVNVR